MDGVHPHFTVRTYISFLLLILLQTSTKAQIICSAPVSVEFAENNVVGDVVATVTVKPGVTLELKPSDEPNNPFRLEGNQLVAARVLDYETDRTHTARIKCLETTTGSKLDLIIVVVVKNENDNPPVFGQNTYDVSVNEMSPVGTTIGNFAATDLDQNSQLYYTLTSESNYFKLTSPTIPDVVTEMLLDYDKVKNVQLVLYVQDTPLTASDTRTSFTATTTIMVTILDVDNRPPWFQPCTKHELGGAVICQSAGYTGRVVLNEQETGVLPLKPGPLYAIDGDSGINEEITYSFLSGNDGGQFEINANSGNISMLKPVSMVETIILTVVGAQRRNSYQFATTTVTIQVKPKSNHLPQFERPRYEGFVTKVGTMVMDMNNKDEPLQILAIDKDYATTGGLNPHITYSVNGSNDFSIVDGYLFMTKDLPETDLSLHVVATDTSNDELATAQLSVRVTSGLTTTALPLSTTDIMTSVSVGISTTTSKTTDDIMSTTEPSISTHNSVSTTIPTEDSVSTTDPSMTSEESVSTASTAHPHTEIIPSGGYGLVDMAILGATLGALLFICLVVIGVLIYYMRKGKADWRKIYEASMFRSSLGQGSGGLKEGIQYTNEAFQNDEDGGSMGSGGVMAGGEPQKAVEDTLLKEVIEKSLAPLHALLPDDTSQAGSDKADSEKEVKPILTKERRMEEGYKSVWFKEDIDPNAKEEVVIIPDSREDDSEEEDEDSHSSIKTPKVFFADPDLDSGLGLKMGDTAEDSDDNEELACDL